MWMEVEVKVKAGGSNDWKDKQKRRQGLGEKAIPVEAGRGQDRERDGRRDHGRRVDRGRQVQGGEAGI